MIAEETLQHAIDYIHARYGGTEAVFIMTQSLRAVRESERMAALASQGVGVLMQRVKPCV
jgi:hypothetical protein